MDINTERGKATLVDERIAALWVEQEFDCRYVETPKPLSCRFATLGFALCKRGYQIGIVAYIATRLRNAMSANAQNHRIEYPIRVREIANKADLLAYKQVVSWSEIDQINLPHGHLDEMLYRRAADAIAREFAGKVSKHMYVSRRDEPEGRVLQIDAVALRYQELLDLLYAAYLEGQSDGMRRSISIHPEFMNKADDQIKGPEHE